ncbi:hypothetical protein EV421DRAFT_382715 [Armillaria borealis]|uniref:Uncharacterized protein n=1 Tax=Armillaria borealis TaxID=47425 RepID=A0AA39MDP4_9AGAR|nr:hypothetical protein EV421DRAFT_382715 [Armillaria borealis]
MLARASGYCLFFQDTFYSFHDTFYSFGYFLFLLIQFNSSASGGQYTKLMVVGVRPVPARGSRNCDFVRICAFLLLLGLQGIVFSFRILSISFRILSIPFRILSIRFDSSASCFSCHVPRPFDDGSYNDPAVVLTVNSLQCPTVVLFHSLQSFLFLSTPLPTEPYEVLPLTYCRVYLLADCSDRYIH